MGVRAIITACTAALSVFSVRAAPAGLHDSELETRADTTTSWWLSTIERNGAPAFGSSPYTIFRNVKDLGAKGDGVTDDSAVINTIIAEGNRCGQGCDSSTNTPAIIYFPPGTYRLDHSLNLHYYTQLIGDATNPPTLLAGPSFSDMAVIDADPYVEGVNWFTNQNNFFRQVRNFKIDLTQITAKTGAGIHWQVAQATSLQNIEFNMQTDADTKQLGIFMDNGSGGFMSDLTFNGGQYGAFYGSQQFTTRNMTFNNCQTAIFMNWNWVWTMQDVTVNNCEVGIDMSNGGSAGQTVGSVLVLDSTFVNTPTGIRTAYVPSSSMTNGTLIIENCDFGGSSAAVKHTETGEVLVAGGGVVEYYQQGRIYDGIQSGRTEQGIGYPMVARPEALTSNGKWFTRSRPQYENVDVSKFVSVKSNSYGFNAAGDGATDDTEIIQKLFNAVADDEIVYFDHGAYIITDTVTVPNNIKITGEALPLIMAGGSKSFKDQNNPKAVFKVGTRGAGDKGAVEMSDLIFETQGPQPGAILMEWNLGQSSVGSNALWDVHFRIGGSAGTQLQSDKCAKNPNVPTSDSTMTECAGAFMHMHITEKGAVYLENCWSWTSDHELDLSDHNQINIFNGRGILVESVEGPVWMWGTASEHNVLFNYQVTNARNVFMGHIQTETPYYQGNPNSLVPYTAQTTFTDPDFETSCYGSTGGCERAWGLRVTNSSDVFLYGGGLYSFFDNYSQDCLETQNCQDNMISFESSNVHVYGVSTKAASNMITVNSQTVAFDSDNRNNFCATIASFHSSPEL